MALNFPASPSTGALHNATNGLQYYYDGVKWTSQGTYSSSAGALLKIDDISSNFNGHSTTFDLHHDSSNISVSSSLDLTINIGGVLQEPDIAYSVNPTASTITFSEAPETGTTFFGVLKSKLADTNVTPTDGTVTTAKIGGSQVTTDKIANDAVDGNKLANNIDIAGTLDVTSNATFDANVSIVGTLAVTSTSTFSNDTTFSKGLIYSKAITELSGTALAVTNTYHQICPSASSTTHAVTTITGGVAGQTLIISGPPEWRASTAYLVGDIVHNDSGKYYKCDRAGTSHSSGGPTGTSSNIEDDGASPDARWDYVGQAGDIVLTDAAEGGTLNTIVGGVTVDVSNGDTAALIYNGYQWLLTSHGNN
tara:strand:+ start:2502 stop:3596 length:1095 start_codon:yes stop_codon:yes gene_type:complete